MTTAQSSSAPQQRSVPKPVFTDAEAGAMADLCGTHQHLGGRVLRIVHPVILVERRHVPRDVRGHARRCESG